MNVAAALIAGFGLGLIYFGGLWATVRIAGVYGASASISVSFAARLAALAVGLCALCARGGDVGRLVSALFGLWLARGGILWWHVRGGSSHRE